MGSQHVWDTDVARNEYDDANDYKDHANDDDVAENICYNEPTDDDTNYEAVVAKVIQTDSVNTSYGGIDEQNTLMWWYEWLSLFK